MRFPQSSKNIWSPNERPDECCVPAGCTEDHNPVRAAPPTCSIKGKISFAWPGKLVKKLCRKVHNTVAAYAQHNLCHQPSNSNTSNFNATADMGQHIKSYSDSKNSGEFGFTDVVVRCFVPDSCNDSDGLSTNSVDSSSLPSGSGRGKECYSFNLDSFDLSRPGSHSLPPPGVVNWEMYNFDFSAFDLSHPDSSLPASGSIGSAASSDCSASREPVDDTRSSDTFITDDADMASSIRGRKSVVEAASAAACAAECSHAAPCSQASRCVDMAAVMQRTLVAARRRALENELFVGIVHVHSEGAAGQLALVARATERSLINVQAML